MLFDADKEKVQSLELFSQLQLLQAYSFCFGLDDKIIHQKSEIVQEEDTYYQAFHDYVYTSLQEKRPDLR